MLGSSLQVTSGAASLGPGLLLLAWANIGSLAVSELPLSELTCQQRNDRLSLPLEANESGFVALSNDTACIEDPVELYCGPKQHSSMYWYMWNETHLCHGRGNQTVRGSTLTIACGNFTLQCVSHFVSQSYSRPVLVTKVTEEITGTLPTEGITGNTLLTGRSAANITPDGTNPPQTNTSLNSDQHLSRVHSWFHSTEFVIIATESVVILISLIVIFVLAILLVVVAKQLRLREREGCTPC